MEQIIQRTALLKSWIEDGTYYKIPDQLIKKLEEIERLAAPLPTRLEDDPRAEGRTYSNKAGTRKIYISSVNLGFVEKLSELPVDLKARIAQFSATQMEEYIASERQDLSAWVTKLLNKKWYWRETGDPAVFEDEYLPLKMSVSKIKAAIKKGKLSLKELNSMIEYFLGDRAEVYTKD